MNKEKQSVEENPQNNESVVNESEETTNAENVPELSLIHISEPTRP